MRRIGLLLTALGLAVLTAAICLAGRNLTEERRAGAASARILSARSSPTQVTAEALGEPEYFGQLDIPVLELVLPILSEWSEENLRIAPCRFSGSLEKGNLVLIAHNYRTHFGPIRRLKPGDPVNLTLAEGMELHYQVIASEVVSPVALEAVTSGSHSLTLITCTYGGKTRLAVYCDPVCQ